MFVYRDLQGHDVPVPAGARVALAEPRACDGTGAHTLVVVTHAGLCRHRPSCDERGALAARLAGHPSLS